MQDNFELQDYLFEVLESIEQRVQTAKQQDLLKEIFKELIIDQHISELGQLLRIKIKILLSKFSLNIEERTLSNVYQELLEVVNTTQNKLIQLETIRTLSMLPEIKEFNKSFLLDDVEVLLEKAFEQVMNQHHPQYFAKACEVLQDLLKIESYELASAIIEQYSEHTELFNSTFEAMKLVVKAITQISEEEQQPTYLVMQVLERYICLIAEQNSEKFFHYYRDDFLPLIQFEVIFSNYEEFFDFLNAQDEIVQEQIIMNALKDINNNSSQNKFKLVILYIKCSIIQEILTPEAINDSYIYSQILLKNEESKFVKFSKANCITQLMFQSRFELTTDYWRVLTDELMQQLEQEKSLRMNFLKVQVLMLQLNLDPNEPYSVEDLDMINELLVSLNLLKNSKILNQLHSDLHLVAQNYNNEIDVVYMQKFLFWFLQLVRFYNVREQTKALKLFVQFLNNEDFESFKSFLSPLQEYVSELVLNDEFNEKHEYSYFFFIQQFGAKTLYFRLLPEQNITDDYAILLNHYFHYFITCEQILLSNYLQKLSFIILSKQGESNCQKSNYNIGQIENFRQVIFYQLSIITEDIFVAFENQEHQLAELIYEHILQSQQLNLVFLFIHRIDVGWVGILQSAILIDWNQQQWKQFFISAFQCSLNEDLPLQVRGNLFFFIKIALIQIEDFNFCEAYYKLVFQHILTLKQESDRWLYLLKKQHIRQIDESSEKQHELQYTFINHFQIQSVFGGIIVLFVQRFLSQPARHYLAEEIYEQFNKFQYLQFNKPTIPKIDSEVLQKFQMKDLELESIPSLSFQLQLLEAYSGYFLEEYKEIPQHIILKLKNLCRQQDSIAIRTLSFNILEQISFFNKDDLQLKMEMSTLKITFLKQKTSENQLDRLFKVGINYTIDDADTVNLEDIGNYDDVETRQLIKFKHIEKLSSHQESPINTIFLLKSYLNDVKILDEKAFDKQYSIVLTYQICKLQNITDQETQTLLRGKFLSKKQTIQFLQETIESYKAQILNNTQSLNQS